MSKTNETLPTPPMIADNEASDGTGRLANDGHSIFYRHWRTSADKAKAVVHINHGMAEHSERYTKLAHTLNAEGYHLIAQDHRGHGQSATQPEQLGHLADKNGWDKVLKDIKVLHGRIKQAYPDLPLVLFGHSMGSFISLNYAELLLGSQAVDALVLSGSTLNPLIKDVGLKVLCKAELKRQGPKGRSALIEEATFKQFNRKFFPYRTESDWLSRDEGSVDEYIKDPLSGFRCTNQTWYDLASALIRIFKPKELKKLPKDLPYYLFFGDDDPLGGKRGNQKLVKALKRAGVKDIAYKGYQKARHETLNETNQDEVIQDLVDWLNSKF